MSDDSTRIKTLEKVVGLHYNDFRCRLLCNDFVATRHRKSPKTRSSWERRVSSARRDLGGGRGAILVPTATMGAASQDVAEGGSRRSTSRPARAEDRTIGLGLWRVARVKSQLCAHAGQAADDAIRCGANRVRACPKGDILSDELACFHPRHVWRQSSRSNSVRAIRWLQEIIKA